MGAAPATTRRDDQRVVVVGPPGAGKTTFVQRLVEVDPPAGHSPLFNIDTVSTEHLHCDVWDLNGAHPDSWRHFLDTCVLVCVLPADCPADLETALVSLERAAAQAPEPRRIPLVIVANRQDRPTAVAPAAIATQCAELRVLQRFRSWHVVGASAAKSRRTCDRVMAVVDRLVAPPVPKGWIPSLLGRLGF